VTFSERLAQYTAGNAPWTLWRPPPGVTLSSVRVSGNTATLILNEGTTIDTVAATFQVALAADPAGIRDDNGNQSSFGPTAVSDGMGPVVVALSSTNVTGGTPGKVERGDTLTLTFSEPLDPSSLPANPTLTLSPGAGTGHDVLTISGLATIDLGAQNAYVTNSNATFAASLTSTGGAVTVTVGANTSGAANVKTAASGTTMRVTPSATVTDSSPQANAADGVFISNPMVLF
jgi:hypothetical protein